MNPSRTLLARVLVVAAAVAVVPVMNPSSVAASPVEDQRQEVQRITDELERLEQESDILAEDYVTAVDEQNQLVAQVAEAEEDVAAKEAEVEGLRGELSEVAVRAFTSSGTDALGPMFSDSSQYTEGLQRDQLASIALSTGTATTDELDQAVSELEAERSELEEMREAAERQTERVEDAKAANEERKAEYESARSAAETKLGELIREEEERRARESYERMQREAEEAAARAAAEAAAAAAAAQQQAAESAVAASSTAPPSNADTSSESSGSSSSTSPSTTPSSSSSAPSSTSDGGDRGDDGDSDSGGGGGSGDGGGESVVAARAPQAPAPQAPAPQPERQEPKPEPVSYPQASSRAGTAVNAALSQLGVPYRFAAAEPGVAFDCSGLTSWAWGQAGVYLPHQSRQQYSSVPHVPASAAQPGDLLFFYSPISHVSIYLGGGQHVHAPNSGTTVKLGTVNWGNVVGVGRPG